MYLLFWCCFVYLSIMNLKTLHHRNIDVRSISLYLLMTYLNLNYYINFHACLSFRPCFGKISSNSRSSITKCHGKSCLIGIKSEKYAFWVTLRPLEFMRQLVKLRSMHYNISQSKANLSLLKLTSVFHHTLRSFIFNTFWRRCFSFFDILVYLHIQKWGKKKN